MIYSTILEGRAVFISVEEIHEETSSGEFLPTGNYVASFRVDSKPGVLLGEFVRDGDKTAVFATKAMAVRAAAAAASRLVDGAT